MVHEIKEAKYEGYIWKSDSSEPLLFDGVEPVSLSFTDGENPFVVEGMLWDSEHGKSVVVRCVDGVYHVAIYEVGSSDADGVGRLSPVSYLPHRMQGVKALKFVRLWEPECDEMCENMDVLRLKATVFVGFEK